MYTISFKKFKSFWVFSPLLLTTCYVWAAEPSEHKYQDAYLKGFETYAKESGLDSFQSYVNEVKALEKSQGYLGEVLPLPAFQEVMPNVYTMTGALMWATKENFGLNNNISFVIFPDGVFLFNAGPNPVVAYSAHKMIKRITSKPIKWIAIENNQGHANLGASYWWDIGVRHIYSQNFAIEDFNKSYERSVQRGMERGDEALYGITRNMSSQYIPFQEALDIDVGGGEKVQLRYFGEAHTRGSTVAYVPSKKLLFTGDLGYADRMIAVFPYTNTQDWMGAFAKMQAFAGDDATVIPGHGRVASMQKVKTDTYDYLVYMRQEVLKLIQQGKGVESAGEIINHNLVGALYIHKPTRAMPKRFLMMCCATSNNTLNPNSDILC